MMSGELTSWNGKHIYKGYCCEAGILKIQEVNDV